MRSRNVTIWVMLGVLLLGCPRLLDAVEFKDGLTHDIDYTIDGYVSVDWQAPGMQTTVNLLPAGYITGSLSGYNDSHLNISGGLIRVFLFTSGSSQVTVSGGLIHHHLLAYDSSYVTMSGGSIDNWLSAVDSSQVDMSGGSIGTTLEAHNSSQVSISGGSIAFSLSAYESSQVTVSGGTIWGELLADDDGILTIYGSDFAVDGIPFGYGELTSIFGGWAWHEPTRHLAGILLSGDLFDNDFRIGLNGKIVLVPEPATIFLLGLGGLALLRRRKT